MKSKKTSKAAERPTAPVSEKTEEITVGDEKTENICSDNNKPSVQSGRKQNRQTVKRRCRQSRFWQRAVQGEEHGCGQNGLQNPNGESDKMSGKTGLAAEGAPCEEQSAGRLGRKRCFRKVFSARCMRLPTDFRKTMWHAM